MALQPPVVLTISGFDPSSGAGATADLKTIAAHGCFGIACIPVITVQNTVAVSRVEPVAPDIIRQTLSQLASDFPIAAIRIGMLGTLAALKEVVDFLKSGAFSHVVLDPVMQSSSGTKLLEPDAAQAMIHDLLPLCDVFTPNLDEAEALSGLQTRNPDQMKVAAQWFHDRGAKGVVITGGHLSPTLDLLSSRGVRSETIQTFESEQLTSSSTHGTGCAFATSIACLLAQNYTLPESVGMAKSYVLEAIRNAYPLGSGRGPINHFYNVTR